MLEYKGKALAGHLANLVPLKGALRAFPGTAERATRCPAPRPTREPW